MQDISPKEIYDFVIDKVEQMKAQAQSIDETSVGASSNENANTEAKARAKELTQAKTLLVEFETNAIKSAQDYKNNAEFDTFVIAFYGETNAGKSTIIEALRIYFDEASKQKERAEFDKNYKRYKAYDKGFFGKILAFFMPFLKAKALEKSIKFSDGVIIGDGRSDFTGKSQIYHFDDKDIKFDILDVPGIEGKENAVIDEILKATKKAHCVFYITREPKPPQKGDSPSGESKGTIEKIKEHLGAQTEVFSVFNKSINNPAQLKDSIIQAGDESGLQDLDKVMGEYLGEHYAGRKTLSAQVAFYALGDKMIGVDLPQNARDEAKKALNLAKKREKFINAYSKDDLLKKSLFIECAEFISYDLAQNVGEKIKKSNFNKAHRILLAMNETLEFMYKTYSKIYVKCAKEVEDSCKNLKRILDSTQNDFETANDKVIDTFKSKVRDKMYEYIENNVSNDSFKSEFKSVIKNEQELLNDEFIKAFEKVQERFVKDIENEIENLQRRIGNIAKEFQSLSINNDFDTNLNINIDSGIDKAGLVGAGIGAVGLTYMVIAANLWNPAGWAAASAAVIATVIISAGTIIFGTWKSVGKIFSSNYKKSEQRKAVDENLRKICQNSKEQVYKSIKNEIDKNLKPQIDKIQNSLQDSVKTIKEASEFFETLRKNEILTLANQIKKEGGLK